jgi:alpha-ketoglutaric semialdehyde dehydrogenase
MMPAALPLTLTRSMPVTGELFIGYDRVLTDRRLSRQRSGARRRRSIHAVQHCRAPPKSRARAALAAAAFDAIPRSSIWPRARSFLESCAATASWRSVMNCWSAPQLETGLPRVRLEGERGRTVGQLRLFAQVVRAGRLARTAHRSGAAGAQAGWRVPTCASA